MADESGRPQLVLMPSGRRGGVDPGANLLEAARGLGVEIESICGGRQTCGKCQVRILSAPIPPPVGAETAVVAAGALEQGYRLACMHQVDRDLTVEILPIVSHGKGEAPPLELVMATLAKEPAADD